MEQTDKAEKIASQIVGLAEGALKTGTFGVGGVLLGPDGAVLKTMRNAVMRKGVVRDPTAHVERQLVDWYFAEREAMPDLPEASDCLLVSSLDPCLMCCGAILASGMKALILSPDDYAGVSWRGDLDFSPLPRHLQDKARDHFAVFGLKGGRDYQGPVSKNLGMAVVDPDWNTRSLAAFAISLTRLRQRPRTTPLRQPVFGGVPEQTNIESPSNIWVHPALADVARAQNWNLLPPRTGLRSVAHGLVRTAWVAKKLGHAFDAAALLDPSGAMIVAATGVEKKSPIRTAFMELARAYAFLRAQEREGRIKIPRGLDLASPQHCQFVTLLGPAQRAVDIMMLGAFGSVQEGAAPAKTPSILYHIFPRQPQRQLDAMIEKFPPFYTAFARIAARPFTI